MDATRSRAVGSERSARTQEAGRGATGPAATADIKVACEPANGKLSMGDVEHSRIHRYLASKSSYIYSSTSKCNRVALKHCATIFSVGYAHICWIGGGLTNNCCPPISVRRAGHNRTPRFALRAFFGHALRRRRRRRRRRRQRWPYPNNGCTHVPYLLPCGCHANSWWRQQSR